jgi:hypothetical protein
LFRREFREEYARGELVMAQNSLPSPTNNRRRCAILGTACLASVCPFLPLSARQQTLTGSATPQSNTAGAGQQNSALGPPAIPVDQIIQKFAAREAEFKTERDNFTYTQTFTIQTLDTSGRPDGEYTMTSEIVFTPSGKRFERVTYAPAPTLERISLSQQDLDDLEHVQPFVLTTAELPKYNITYVGHEQLDELTTSGPYLGRRQRLRHCENRR